MNNIDFKIKSFLKKNNSYFEDIDSEKYINDFIKQMYLGLSGEESPLKMIPTYIKADTEIPHNQDVIVLDAGGTNLRTAKIFFNEKNEAVINEYNQHKMPGADKEILKEDFFYELAGKIKNILNSSLKIGFCFSYPTEMYPDKDGRLISMSKEMKIKNLVGELIGANLNKKIISLGYSEKKIILLNDTVSVLLAGLKSSNGKKYSTYLGFILGTGTNACYIESNMNIKKLKNLPLQEEQIINIEAGNFNGFALSDFDKEVDLNSNDKGCQLFEKMVSGRYFGSLSLVILKKAAEEKLFSENLCPSLNCMEDLKTSEINDFLNNQKNNSSNLESVLKSSNHEDRIFINNLFLSIIERNAKLAAIVLSAIILKKHRDKALDGPVCITAEGTTFYKLKGLKEKIEQYLDLILTKENKIKFEIVNIENAALIGSGIAGLIN